LVGGHADLDCATCHGAGTGFGGLSPECSSCHLDDFQRTRDPDHARLNFDLDCRRCHSVFGWDGAFFRHPGSFPLSGGHAGRACTDCHAEGRFQGTPTDCVACHQADYDNARDPDHRAAGFPTSCAQCHGTTTWEGARFDHRFPIQGGAHAGLSCAECHDVPAQPAAFTCTNCHEHGRTDMDGEHREVRDYVYATPDCYRCHPDGRER
jgi:hypothetical protein